MSEVVPRVRRARRTKGLTADLLLAVVALGLVTGAVARLAGAPDLADVAWRVATVVGVVPLLASVTRSAVRREPGVDLIALLAMVGALALGQSLAGAVIAVMLGTGRRLERSAAERARRELHGLVGRAPRSVVRHQDGQLVSVNVDEVKPDDVLTVRPGDIVAVDGTICGGVAVLDESALTGEAHPVERADGEPVRSGVVNAGPPFDLRATATAAESTYAAIVRLVGEAQSARSPMKRLADRFALAFVPLTLGLAAAAWLLSGDGVRALAVLVVATPCPLLLAVPVAVVSGISRAAQRGVIVKGGGALETLGRARVLLFDKTGTLTSGRARVTEIHAPEVFSSAEVLRFAAAADQVSAHVLAVAIVRAARERGMELPVPEGVIEEPGRGVRARIDGQLVAVGRGGWVAAAPQPQWARRLRRRTSVEGLPVVWVALDGKLCGAVVLEDRIRPDAARTIRRLRRAGLERVVMITGDHAEIAAAVGAAIGVDLVLAERTPTEKLAAVLAERRHGTVVMVGDGINDAPALAAADVGVALAARGATASSEAADVVLVTDRLERLGDAIYIAKRTRRIALQSVIAGMALSLLAMGVAAAGLLPPIPGAVLQEGIDVVVIVNALRVLRERGQRQADIGGVALARRIDAEHTHLADGIEDLRRVADRLGVNEGQAMLADLHELADFLRTVLLPHEVNEEATLYPLVGELVGGDDPTETMIRAHVEIAHLIRLIGRAVDDLPADGPSSDDLPELRRLLYGLHAVLRLHNAQEDEAFLSRVGAAEDGLVPART